MDEERRKGIVSRLTYANAVVGPREMAFCAARRWRRVTYVTVIRTFAVFIALGSGSDAASSSTVVPPNGRVDGRTYGQWLAKAWRTLLATPPGAAYSCPRVGEVELFPFVSNRRTHTCSIPGGSGV